MADNERYTHNKKSVKSRIDSRSVAEAPQKPPKNEGREDVNRVYLSKNEYIQRY